MLPRKGVSTTPTSSAPRGLHHAIAFNDTRVLEVVLAQPMAAYSGALTAPMSDAEYLSLQVVDAAISIPSSS
jgi:hypothetical protein